jgi:CheY-like chemotaxis protein
MQQLAVLVVDDTANIRELLASALKDFGCRVFTADGGNDGFALLIRERVDLLITDLRMENGTGIELIRRLRRVKRAGEPVPEIVVYTGLCSKAGESYLKSLGASAVWLKETSPGQFIASLMKQRRSPEDGSKGN